MPYDRYAINGYLSLTDCNGHNAYILDYKFIANYLKNFIKDNNLTVLMLGYDEMGIGGIMQDLDDIETEKVPIGQYPKSLNETCRNFQGTVAGRAICYDKNNELLNKSIVNAVCVYNSKKELIIDKKMQRNRIDAIDALIDAWKCMLLAPQNNESTDSIDDWLHLLDKMLE